MKQITMLSNMLRNIWFGVVNLVIWFPYVWRDRDWDFTFLTRIMEFKLRKMSRNMSEYGYIVGKEKYARQMLITAEILRRITTDNFDMFYKHQKEFKPVGRYAVRLHGKTIHFYYEYLGKMLTKHLATWWD